METKLLHDEEEVLLFLSKARGFVSQGNYDDAMRQVALAFKINPFDDEITKLQREILDGQKKAKIARKLSLQKLVEPETSGDRETAEHIRRHVEQAKKMRTESRFQEALDEIAQAYRIDPMNEKLFSLEGEIQQEFLHYEEQQQNAQLSLKNDQGIKKSLAMAREALSREAYSEALGWVDYAMSFDMKNFETLQLREEIEHAQRLLENKKANDDKELVIQFHLSKAMEFLSANKVFDAIFEVDLALRLNSAHPDALLLRKRLNEMSNESTLSP
jgi:tetratricopeptide (TPR) repeat protein